MGSHCITMLYLRLAVCFILVCFVTCKKNGDCPREGAKALGRKIKVGSLKTNSAGLCQVKCQENDDCEFWTWLGQDKTKKRRYRCRCYLLETRTNVKKRHMYAWGPKYCWSTKYNNKI